MTSSFGSFKIRWIIQNSYSTENGKNHGLSTWRSSVRPASADFKKIMAGIHFYRLVRAVQYYLMNVRQIEEHVRNVRHHCHHKCPSKGKGLSFFYSTNM